MRNVDSPMVFQGYWKTVSALIWGRQGITMRGMLISQGFSITVRLEIISHQSIKILLQTQIRRIESNISIEFLHQQSNPARTQNVRFSIKSKILQLKSYIFN